MAFCRAASQVSFHVATVFAVDERRVGPRSHGRHCGASGAGTRSARRQQQRCDVGRRFGALQHVDDALGSDVVELAALGARDRRRHHQRARRQSAEHAEGHRRAVAAVRRRRAAAVRRVAARRRSAARRAARRVPLWRRRQNDAARHARRRRVVRSSGTA